MTDLDFTLELFCRVDDRMPGMKKHSQAKLHPSELVTLGLLFALKGRGGRAFYRWLKRNFSDWFDLPDRTRFFRQLVAHRNWIKRFLAEPGLLCVADTYGIELIHPRREGRSEAQIGKKGVSNHRWIVGVKLGFVLNHLGRVVDWEMKTANVHDSKFQPMIARHSHQCVILADQGFHAMEGDPSNLKICKRGSWNERMLIETALSMLTGVCLLKKASQRTWKGLKARVAFVLAVFNLLLDWQGEPVKGRKRVRIALAKFAL